MKAIYLSLYVLLCAGSIGALFGQTVPASSPVAPDSSPAAPASSPATSPALDYGDFQSQTLVGKAGDALGAKNYDAAVGYADKCIELFGKQAADQQKSLTALPTDKDQIFAQWALNDVGYAYFLKGQALEGLGKNPAAAAAYKFLVQNLAFSQVWDTQGWFWKPADAAGDRLKATEFSKLY